MAYWLLIEREKSRYSIIYNFLLIIQHFREWPNKRSLPNKRPLYAVKIIDAPF